MKPRIKPYYTKITRRNKYTIIVASIILIVNLIMIFLSYPEVPALYKVTVILDYISIAYIILAIIERVKFYKPIANSVFLVKYIGLYNAPFNILYPWNYNRLLAKVVYNDMEYPAFVPKELQPNHTYKAYRFGNYFYVKLSKNERVFTNEL